MEDLSLHILDIAENSVAAGANLVRITLCEDMTSDRLTLEINDDGSGMEYSLLAGATSPFTTTRTTRQVGLGLPMLAQSAQNAEGRLEIDSNPGKGTRVRATFRLGHIDRIPLGDLEQTLMTLIVGNPEIDFEFVYRRNSEEFKLDTKRLRQLFGCAAFCSPEALKALRKLIKDGFRIANGKPAQTPMGCR